MKFFQLFPTTPYTLTEVVESTAQPLTRTIPNMTVKMAIDISDGGSVSFTTYRIADSDRPDTVSAIMYGSSQYAWVILMANNMRDWYDWPLTDYEFAKYMNRKYESSVGANDGINVSGSTVAKYVWYTTDGQTLEVDSTAYASLPVNQKATITVYEQEYQENDAKRTIRIPNLEALTGIVNQLTVVLGS